MNSFSKLLLIITIALTLALPTIASAQVAANTTSFLSGYQAGTLTLNVPIGQLSSCSIGMAGKPNNCLGLYIQAWYGFTLGVVGILATIMMMYAGFKYLISRGDGKAIGDAKDLMISGITGVVLAFLSYTILNLVSPNLLVIHIPAIPAITDNSGININEQKNSPGWTSGGAGSTGVTTNCPPGQTTIVNGYDFKGYAESCDHVMGVQRLYDQFKGRAGSATEIDALIKGFAPSSLVTGQMVINASNQYGVDAAVILAEMAQDSGIGTKEWGARTNNPGNVGNYGTLDTTRTTNTTTNSDQHYTEISQTSPDPNKPGGLITTYNSRTYDSWAAGVNGVGNWLTNKKVK